MRGLWLCVSKSKYAILMRQYFIKMQTIDSNPNRINDFDEPNNVIEHENFHKRIRGQTQRVSMSVELSVAQNNQRIRPGECQRYRNSRTTRSLCRFDCFQSPAYQLITISIVISRLYATRERCGLRTARKMLQHGRFWLINLSNSIVRLASNRNAFHRPQRNVRLFCWRFLQITRTLELF